MRFYNLVAILALGGVSAQIADDEGARNLRGSEPDEVEIEGRDLLVTASAGSYSKSASVNLWKCWKGDTCTNIYEDCYATAFSLALTYTSTAGGSYSAAEAAFAADACCSAMAEAAACSIACVKAKGKIDLYATRSSKTGMSSFSAMDFELYAKLTSATMTIAKASSSAEAEALAAVSGGVFVGTEADYCNGGGMGSYNCDPAGAVALAEATAAGYGDASALADASAGSGTSTYVKGVVKASGSSVDQIYGLFTSVAKSFSWASAYTQAVAGAYAESFAGAEAIATHCGKAYDDHCGCPSCTCKWASKEEACSAAVAFGVAGAATCGSAVAQASAAASADVMVAMTWGGTLTNCKNDGKPLNLEWANGAPEGELGCALVCPRY